MCKYLVIFLDTIFKNLFQNTSISRSKVLSNKELNTYASEHSQEAQNQSLNKPKYCVDDAPLIIFSLDVFNISADYPLICLSIWTATASHRGRRVKFILYSSLSSLFIYLQAEIMSLKGKYSLLEILLVGGLHVFEDQFIVLGWEFGHKCYRYIVLLYHQKGSDILLWYHAIKIYQQLFHVQSQSLLNSQVVCVIFLVL